MANFTPITGKKKDYSIADLLGFDGAKTQSKTPSAETGNETTGTFKVPSISDVVSGIDSKLEEIAPSLPGITNIGAAIKSYYNSKDYADDRAKAEAKLEEIENSKPTYSESDRLTDARDELTEIEGYWKEKYPDGYQSKYGDKISELIGKLEETEKFNYDVESDPLWNSIKDQYQRNALLGMQNAIGDAAALTGGYGSSNAVIAGQQAYQQSISEMTDIIPKLHDTALGAWQANRGALTDNLYAVMNAEDMEYSKWQDEYNMWANDRDYMAQKVANMSDEEFDHYLAELSSWQTDRAYYAGQKQTTIANQQWQAEMDENRRQFNQQMAFNYINMGVGAAVDLTTAGMSAGVDLIGIGADTALGAAGLAMDDRHFNLSLAQEEAMSQQSYDLALKELEEEQRQLNIKNGVGTQTVSTQSVDKSGNEPVAPKKVEENNSKSVYGPMTTQNVYSDIENSTDKKAAIRKAYINGVIDDDEYDKLKNQYQIYG